MEKFEMNIPDPQAIEERGVLSQGLVQEKVCTKRWAGNRQGGTVV
jgi:hypothetical protein